MENKSLFISIPHVIYADAELSPQAKLILSEILSLLKVDRRWCWASNEHFASMFSIERANVSYHIQQIEKLGWIISEAVKVCHLDQCQLKNKGWHRHIKAGVHLSKILDSLSSKTGYPIKSVGTISNTVNNTVNIDTIVSTAKAEKKGFGNEEIEIILTCFKQKQGYIPSDKYPRQIAQHIRVLIQGFLARNKENYLLLHHKELTLPYTVEKSWVWLLDKDYAEHIEKLETYKLKLRMFLSSQEEKLLEERRKYDQAIIENKIRTTGEIGRFTDEARPLS